MLTAAGSGWSATTALLLGGDAVELVVEVGPGAVLDLFDVAGTVAYHGRGRSGGVAYHSSTRGRRSPAALSR